MAALVPLDAQGEAAPPGTPGRWLTQLADVLGSDQTATRLAREGEALALTFPRGWPAVFKENAALKGLVKAIRGTRARVVGLPCEEEAAAIASVGDMYELHSFLNAERIAASLPGWTIVKGFQVFEDANESEGKAYIAIRHWWVARDHNVWVNPTPALVSDALGNEVRTLLIESVLGDKEIMPLTVQGREVARHLARRLLAGTNRLKVSVAPKVLTQESEAFHKSMQQVPPQADKMAGAQATGASIDVEAGGETLEHLKTRSDTEMKGKFSNAQEMAFRAKELNIEELSAEELSAIAQLKFSASAGLRAKGDGLFREGKLEAADACYAEAAAPRVARAEVLKVEGNDAFERNDLALAALRYEAALAEVDSNAVTGLGVDQSASAFARVLRKKTPVKLLVALRNNSAAVYIKLERYEEAVSAASEALKLEPKDLKARLRRATAQRALGELHKACDDLGHLLYLNPQPETARTLLEVWLTRVPGIQAFIAESRLAARKIGRQNGSEEHGDAALALATCRALHGHGTCSEWCRFTPSEKRGVGAIDAARCLARGSARDLILTASHMMRKAKRDRSRDKNPFVDEYAVKALLRLAAWIVGLKGSVEAEAALVELINAPIAGELPTKVQGIEHTTTYFESLVGSEVVTIESCRLVEALARRRPSNAPYLPGDVLQRIFSFRASWKVRRTAMAAMSWMARCPKGKRWLEPYESDPKLLKPHHEEVRCCMEYCKLARWLIPDTTCSEYHAETGICIGEGGHLSSARS